MDEPLKLWAEHPSTGRPRLVDTVGDAARRHGVAESSIRAAISRAMVVDAQRVERARVPRKLGKVMTLWWRVELDALLGGRPGRGANLNG